MANLLAEPQVVGSACLIYFKTSASSVDISIWSSLLELFQNKWKKELLLYLISQ